MKKILTVATISFSILSISISESAGQTPASVRKQIEQANKQFIRWFNTSKADSIMFQYSANACITDVGCGRKFLQQYYQGEMGKYIVREVATLSVTVKDKIATEEGQWKVLLPNGAELSGKYRTEWLQEDKRWLILKETRLDQ